MLFVFDHTGEEHTWHGAHAACGAEDAICILQCWCCRGTHVDERMQRIQLLGKESKEERHKRLLAIAEEEVRWLPNGHLPM